MCQLTPWGEWLALTIERDRLALQLKEARLYEDRLKIEELATDYQLVAERCDRALADARKWSAGG